VRNPTTTRQAAGGIRGKLNAHGHGIPAEHNQLTALLTTGINLKPMSFIKIELELENMQNVC
jgi:hypothetical protein